MTAKPIYAFLEKFGPAQIAPVMELCERDIEAEHRAEIEAAREEAYAQGLQEGLVQGEHLVAAERERSAAELAALHRSAIEAEAASIQARLEEGICAIQTHVGDALGGILEKFVDEAIKAKAIDALARALAEHLSHERHPLLRISGPPDLIENLRTKISDRTVSIDLAPNDERDVTVVDGSTRFSTRLEYWRSELFADITAGGAHV